MPDLWQPKCTVSDLGESSRAHRWLRHQLQLWYRRNGCEQAVLCALGMIEHVQMRQWREQVSVLWRVLGMDQKD